LDHPNIVRCYGFGEDEKNIFALLEYVDRPHHLTDIIDDDM
jgi:serine/threonine protein kinase